MDYSPTNGLGETLLPNNKLNQHATQYRNSIFLLLFTIVLESSGTLLLKRAFEDYRCTVIAFVCYFSSLGLFSVVLRTIPLSIAYTTWCTLGTVTVCLLSKVFYSENISIAKGFCIVLTVPCVIGMYVLP